MIAEQSLHMQNSQIYADWIRPRLQANVFVVATLKQAMTCHHGAVAFRINGTTERYAQAYDQFIRRLTQSVYGKTHWRRHRRLLKNNASLEGGGLKRFSSAKLPYGKRPYPFQSGRDGVRYHLNMCLRRPDWISFEDFAAKIRSAWAKVDWGLPDIFIEESTGDCVGYSLKEGPEALLPNSMSF